MNRLILVILASCISMGSYADEADLRYGTIDVPAGWVFRRLPGMDSRVADIVRTNDGFTIHCDIGKMAGHSVGPRSEGYKHRRLHTINGAYACTGIQDNRKGCRIATTVSSLLLADAIEQARQDGADAAEIKRLTESLGNTLAKHKSGAEAPANFIAECRDEADVLDFMLVVGTYRTKEDGPSNGAIQASDAGASQPNP